MPPIKMPMDQELYDAAVKVMDAIEEKLYKTARNLADEDVLGRATATAYQAYQTLRMARYIAESPQTAAAAPEATGAARGPRQRKPPSQGHPWRQMQRR